MRIGALITFPEKEDEERKEEEERGGRRRRKRIKEVGGCERAKD